MQAFNNVRMVGGGVQVAILLYRAEISLGFPTTPPPNL
jgi:hypothetical protein